MKPLTTILIFATISLLIFTIYQQRILFQHLTAISNLERRTAQLEQDLQLAEEVLIQTRGDTQMNNEMIWYNWMRIRSLFYDYYGIQLQSDKER
jgi:type II secretory pathway component PulJ